MSPGPAKAVEPSPGADLTPRPASSPHATAAPRPPDQSRSPAARPGTGMGNAAVAAMAGSVRAAPSARALPSAAMLAAPPLLAGASNAAVSAAARAFGRGDAKPQTPDRRDVRPTAAFALAPLSAGGAMLPADPAGISSERRMDSRDVAKDQGEVMRREVGQVTSERGIQARRQAGGPVMLVPLSTPPSPAKQLNEASKSKSHGKSAGDGAGRAEQADGKEKSAPAEADHSVAAASRQPASTSSAMRPHAETISGAHGSSHPAQAYGPSAGKTAGSKGASGRATHAQRAKTRDRQTNVPAVQPKARSAQLPARLPTLAEFQAELQFPGDVAARRAHVDTLLQHLHADATKEKQNISSQAATSQAAIMADAGFAAEGVRKLSMQHRAAVHATFTAARKTLESGNARRRGQIVADVAKDAASAQGIAAAAIASARDRGQTTRTALRTFAEDRRREPLAIAREEARRASAELEQAARECESAGAREAARHPGSEDSAPDQREAAREVAAGSAADIREKKPALAQDLMERAAGFSGQYFEYSDAVSAQISEALTQLASGIGSARDDAVGSIRATEAGARKAVDDRHKADLAALGQAEASSLSQLQHAEQAALGQLKQQALAGCSQAETAANALTRLVDVTVEETAAAARAEAVPSLGGMTDLIDHAGLQVRATGQAGAVQLRRLAGESRGTLTATVDAFRGGSAQMVHAAAPAVARIVTASGAAMERTLQARSQRGLAILVSLRARQDAMAAGIWKEIDRAAGQAREKMLGINAQFRSDIHRSTDESIDKAKKPRTDTAETRVAEAAEQAGESWFTGLLRAVGQIIKGLVILVVFALVVAAIAAACGVLLTAWTAVMIAGAILLAFGLVMAIIHRAGQDELKGKPFAIIGYALLDTVGVTGIIESIRGKDLVTDEALSAADRTERGILGVVTLVSLVFGARAAIKGPPSGFVRPGSLEWGGFGEFFKGWVGFREFLPAVWKGVRGVVGELYTGLRQSAFGLKEWIGRKLGRGASEIPEVAPKPQTKPTERKSGAAEEVEPPTIDASSKVVRRSDGSYRLNRKNFSHPEKVTGGPESRVLQDANREAIAAELAADKPFIDEVYMGEEADAFINGSRGEALSADVVAVTNKGEYYVYEAKGSDISHGLEQLEHTSRQLGPGRVRRQTIVTKEKITTPGYTVKNGVLMSEGKPVLISGKPVHIKFTTQ